MAEIPRKVRIEVDLDDLGLRETIEQITRTAFLAGFEIGAADADRYEAPVLAYEDWRAFGPGLNLPAGQFVRARVAGERNAARAQAQPMRKPWEQT